MYILFVAFTMVACQKEEKISREQLIDQELNQRIHRYTIQVQRKCREKMLSKIEYEVDSMMYYLVNKMTGKEEHVPPRPNRPPRLVDTISLEVLDSLEKSSTEPSTKILK